MAKSVKVTLQRFSAPMIDIVVPNEAALSYLHGRTISLPEIPLPGDFIQETECGEGYVEVAKRIFALDGSVTLAIK